MDKKKRKSRPVKESTDKKKEEEQNSEIDVDSVKINDDHWQCIVGFLVERKGPYAMYTKYMNDAIETGLRKVIKCITHTDIVTLVKQFRSDVAAGNTSAPCNAAHQKLCDEAYPYTASLFESNIPARLLSRLIKYQILKMKDEDIKRKMTERLLAKEIQEESKMMLTAKSLTVGVSREESQVTERRRGKQVIEINKGKEKKGTKLRKRGEEWKDIEFIDDAPRGGANLYIVLSGFYDANLPMELINIGIPLRCVIQMQTDEEDYTFENERERSCTASLRRLSGDLKPIGSTTSTIDAISIKMQEVTTFWGHFDTILWNPANMLTFNDVAFMTLILPTEVELGPEEDDQKQMMYDMIAYLMYDVQDTIRQHQHYLKNMKVWQFDTEPHKSLDKMKIYNSQLEVVPNECTTIPIILDCILDQVEYLCLTEHGSSSTTINSPSMKFSNDSTDIVRASLELTFAELNAKHNLFDVTRDAIEFTEPLIVIHGDDILKKTFDCYFPQFDIQEITFNLLSSIPPVRLWDLYDEISSKAEIGFQFYLNILLQCLDNASDMHTLHNHLNALICHQIKCSKISDLYLSESSHAPRHNQPSLFSNNRLPKKNCNISNSKNRFFKNAGVGQSNHSEDIAYCSVLTELAHHDYLGGGKRDDSDDHKYRYVEEKSSNVLVQSLQDAFVSFACLDHQYFAPTDTLLLKFHNPANSDGISRDYYDVDLTTPVSLRDFYEYVMDEEWDWISNEEAKYQTNMKAMYIASTPSYPTETSEEAHQQITSVSCHNFTDMDFLSKVSLKYEKLKRMDSFNITINSQEENGTSSTSKSLRKDKKADTKKKAKRQSSLEDGFKKTNRNTKGDILRQSKKVALKESIDSDIPQTDIKVPSRFAEEGEPYSFIGFDLGPMRLHISAETTRFYSSDGSLVEVDFRQWLYRWTVLSVKLVVSGNTLMFFHYELPTNTLLPVLCHVVMNCGIIIVFGKPKLVAVSTEVSAENKSESASIESRQESLGSESLLGKKRPRRQHFAMPEHFKSKAPDESTEDYMPLACELKLSWPSSLVLETVKDPFVPFYIKQSYLCKSPLCTSIRDENYRCYLRNGVALKFMLNGDVEIFNPDSTIVKCLEFRPPKPQSVTKEDDVDTKLDEKKEEEPRSKGKGKRPDSKVDDGKKSSRKKMKHNEKEIVTDEYTEEPEQDTSTKKKESCIPALWEITEHYLIMPNGRTLLFKEGIGKECFPKYTVRTRSDIELGEIFIRRGECTHRLIQSDGTHVVNFTDGTRITQSVATDAEQVFCEWSAAEVDTFFPKANESVDSLLRPSKSNSTFKHLDEGYVSFRVMYRIEHPNYVTVTYNWNGCLAELIMPEENAVVKILPDGTYSVSMKEDTILEVTGETVHFRHIDPDNGAELCSSTLNVFQSDKDLCCTTDSQGKTFRVSFSGETYINSEEDKSTKVPLRRGIAVERYFAIKRNLKGLELLHETDVHAMLETLSHKKYSSIVSDTFPDGQHLAFHILMSSLDKSESQSWLVDYKPVKITSKERRDNNSHARSTYGYPPSWFHPFPKRSGWNEKTTEDDIPEVLEVRMIKEIAPSNSNLYQTLRENLLQYSEMTGECLLPPRGMRQESLTMTFNLHEPEYPRYKSHMQPHRQFFNTPIATELYRLGRRQQRKLTPSEVLFFKQHNVSNLVTMAVLESRLERKRKSGIEYRNALRNHTVPPYFSSPQGEAFLLVKECADRAVAQVEASSDSSTASSESQL